MSDSNARTPGRQRKGPIGVCSEPGARLRAGGRLQAGRRARARLLGRGSAHKARIKLAVKCGCGGCGCGAVE